jgi:hypothetical protein
MQRLLTLLGRGRGSQDRIRESTAMTTVYLLEMNRKFEAYMRLQVDALEKRVAATQARPGKAVEEELAADVQPIAETVSDDKTADVAVEPVATAQISLRDSGVAAQPEVDDEAEFEVEPQLEPELDYLSLLGGTHPDEAVAAPESEDSVDQDDLVETITEATASAEPVAEDDSLIDEPRSTQVSMLGGHTALGVEAADVGDLLEEDGTWETALPDDGPKTAWT